MQVCQILDNSFTQQSTSQPDILQQFNCKVLIQTQMIASVLSLFLLCSSARALLVSKRGVGTILGNCTVHESLANLTWFYNWGKSAPNITAQCTKSLGHEFVPMQWGKSGIDSLESAISPNAKSLLAFNEPNQQGQSNVTPQEASELWPQIEAVAHKFNLRIGSPSAVYCGANCITASPFDWWDQWLGNCTSGCHFDFLATHYYSCDIQEFKSFLGECWNKYQKPIWITEFCCPLPNGPLSKEEDFMQSALTVLEQDTHVERYAWFSTQTSGWLGTVGSLLNDDNSPTELGKLYDSFYVQ
jgi:hypothetical protein